MTSAEVVAIAEALLQAQHGGQQVRRVHEVGIEFQRLPRRFLCRGKIAQCEQGIPPAVPGKGHFGIELPGFFRRRQSIAIAVERVQDGRAHRVRARVVGRKRDGPVDVGQCSEPVATL